MTTEKKRRKKPKVRDLPPTRRRVNGERVFYPKGKAIRISSEVYTVLARKVPGVGSWDKLFRRMLNMKQRVGSGEADRKLHEAWLLPSTGQTARTEALARGLSLKNGVLRGKEGKFEVPVLVREVI